MEQKNLFWYLSENFSIGVVMLLMMVWIFHVGYTRGETIATARVEAQADIRATIRMNKVWTEMRAMGICRYADVLRENAQCPAAKQSPN